MPPRKGKSDALRQLLKEDLMKQPPKPQPTQGGNDMSNQVQQFTQDQKVIALAQAVQNSAVMDEVRGELGDTTADAIIEFSHDLSNGKPEKAGSGLDKSLMAEIGKAYRTAYDNFNAAGDTKNAERSMGAMQAVKRIMDMMS